MTFSAFFALVARAQDNLDFDPSGNSNTLGGSGSFNTSDYYDSSTSTEVPGFTDGDNAYFDGAAGNVTVDAPVTAGYLEVNTGGDVTFGASNTTNAITIAGGPSYSTAFSIDQTSGNVTFNAPVNFQLPTSTVYGIFGNSSATNTTFNAINFTGAANNYPGTLRLSGTYTFNGAIANNTASGGDDQGIDLESGTSTFTSTSSLGSGVFLALDGGTALLQTSNLGSDPINADSGSLLTDVAGLNVTNTIQFGGIVGGATAAETTFSGNQAPYFGSESFTAAAGGKVNFTGVVGTGGTVTFTKVGAGIVNFTNGGNTVGNGGTMEIQNGTLLLNNTPGNGNALNNGTLTIDSVTPAAATLTTPQITRATLGGTGSTNSAVVAAGPNSTIAPGDMSISGASSIGTLTLSNGLTASNGLTMDFVLDGEGTAAGQNNSLLIASSLTLSGTVTINLTALDALLTGTGNDYTLFVDNDGSPIGTPTFDIVTPAGYALDKSYGDGAGYVYSGGAFSVQLMDAPEPSTYALFFGGLGLLVLISRFRGKLGA